ncbi:Small nuclear ribonucleoprotein G Short=snRNP-G; Short=Sm protein G; Short=Sm-G; Short=SmG [Cyberlindnera jadinii]|uniref:Small nuclear ribonucleoprotein G n=1 Tax=Cyberlindnera jadinii (strain ATCC 18201 / CBS 1600 / BCRC 20928 / JCM 3617 / NBRC 0987 / NRRL Y-1542) TaxID=983966 RepID=A0A0H5C3W8_CYBJN|nr:small nuclear ribonucleo protein G (snRNP-G) [Cyberlindnera jadinii NRRL Y-1542]ODV75493.1 small nuclear ribonucleo protein G (snRNP-G) [Cyberlindnera jadinii NRRL Y-1542]CEP22621.1 Small nuclear ribonucleoprotein G Short=snRNP-G; Short=Sm protein G; Short=Sm-G; Short=SmG [Cyberlindnera jadinii]
MVSTPELKKYMDKRVTVALNGSRKVTGNLRGYDIFLNIVLEDATEDSTGTPIQIGSSVVRGNSILSIECLESI